MTDSKTPDLRTKADKWEGRMIGTGIAGLVLVGLGIVGGLGAVATYGVVNMAVAALSADVNVWPNIWPEALRVALLGFPTFITGAVVAGLGFGTAKLIDALS